MIEINKNTIRSWSIMGINPAVWSVGFDEVAKRKLHCVIHSETINFLFYTGVYPINNVVIASGI